jgi:membrane protease YdiL (CAAX protease family)
MQDRGRQGGARRPGWMNLGAVVLLPAAGAVLWLDLQQALTASSWARAALGVPGIAALVLVSTFVAARRGPVFALRQALVTLAAPSRVSLSGATILRSALAATGEELLFRLLGLWLLGQGALGVGVTTAAFALSHLLAARPGRRLRAVVDAALCGALLAGLFVITGGVAAPIIAHFGRNLCFDALRRLRAERRRSIEEGEEVLVESAERSPDQREREAK